MNSKCDNQENPSSPPADLHSTTCSCCVSILQDQFSSEDFMQQVYYICVYQIICSSWILSSILVLEEFFSSLQYINSLPRTNLLMWIFVCSIWIESSIRNNLVAPLALKMSNIQNIISILFQTQYQFYSENSTVYLRIIQFLLVKHFLFSFK